MADGAFDPKQVFADPDFRQLPGNEKIKVLEHLDPDFRGLPLAEKAKAVQSLLYQTPMQPKQDQGSFFGTLATDVAGMPQALWQTVRHPIQTGSALIGQQREQLEKASQAYQRGDLSSAFGYGLAGALPLVGPAAAQAGEEFGTGRIGPGAAHTLELLGPEAAKAVPLRPPLVRAAPVPAVERQAVQAAERAGVPLSVGQQTGRIGLQKLERGLQNFPGSERRATDFFVRQQEALATRGRQLAGQAAPTQANAYESGVALQGRLRQRITRLKGYADNLYDSVRQDTAAAQERVPVGRREIPGERPEATLHPSGMPRTETVYGVLETPVDLAPMRQALQPLYDDLTRAMPEARRANSPAFTTLRDLMTSDQQYMNAMDFDRSLGAIKALARDGDSPYLSTRSQRVAKAVIGAGEKQLSDALGKVSPDIETRLVRARRAVRSYHETAELLQDLGEEPARVYQNLTTGGDRVLEMLKDLRQMAPRELQTVGRTYLEGLLDKATAEGGFRRAEGVMADWRRMGPETKQLMFGNRLTADLDDFFLAAKKLAPAEGSPTAGRLAAMLPLRILAAPVSMGTTEFVLPNVLARMLLTPGGARLMTRGITLPPGSGALREIVRGLSARTAVAEEQARADRARTPASGTQTPAGGSRAPRAGFAPDLRQHILSVAERHSIPPGLLNAMIQVESGGDPSRVSPKGAKGLTQLMPATAREVGVRDPFDPYQSVEGGASYLRKMMNRYGDWRLALAAYNAGPGAVDAAGGRVPNIKETREYVNKVMGLLRGAT